MFTLVNLGRRIEGLDESLHYHHYPLRAARPISSPARNGQLPSPELLLPHVPATIGMRPWQTKSGFALRAIVYAHMDNCPIDNTHEA